MGFSLQQQARHFSAGVLGFFLTAGLCVGAGEASSVTFTDGSIVKGTLVSMTGGSLVFAPSVGGTIKVPWEKVKELRTEAPVVVRLKDGSEVRGSVLPGAEPSTMRVQLEGAPEALSVPLAQVEAVNPPEKKPVTYKGNVNAGVSASDGNTRNRTGNLVGEFEARSTRHRFTLGGVYNYAEDSRRVTQRNAQGRIKYDFFPAERLFLFASAFLEGDTFQDLNLRTALSGGPGYQLIDEGDLPGEFFSTAQLYAEGGVAFFNEDFKSVPDKATVSARWAAKLDWPVPPARATIFHRHEGYPGLEERRDLYVTTQQGIRFTLWKNFTAGFQVNWRWDNTPAQGFKRSDTLYLLTLGYTFDL